MLIEPERIAPRGRLWRPRMVVAAVAPVAVLASVVGIAVLAAPSPRANAPAGPAEARPQSAPSAAAVPSAATSGITSSAAIPPRALGLPTRTVAATLEARRALELGDELVAVRGYLTVGRTTEDCVTGGSTPIDPAEPFACRRSAILRDGGEPAFSIAGGQLHWDVPRDESHLHPTIFPGISLGPLDPTTVTAGPVQAMDVEDLEPVPVIVIGRFDDPRVTDRRSSSRHPNEQFVIERLVWADGRWQDRRHARLSPWQTSDLDLRTARAVAAEALPGGTVILSQNVIDAAILGAIDADAGAAVGDIVDPTARLWYVRAMTRERPPIDTLADGGGPRRVGWVVIANDGTILAARRDG